MAGLFDGLFGGDSGISFDPNAFQALALAAASAKPGGGLFENLPTTMALVNKQSENDASRRAWAQIAQKYGLDPNVAASPEAMKMLIGLEQQRRANEATDQMIRQLPNIFGVNQPTTTGAATAAPPVDLLSPKSVADMPATVPSAAAPPPLPPPEQTPGVPTFAPIGTKKTDNPPANNTLYPTPAAASTPQGQRAMAHNMFLRGVALEMRAKADPSQASLAVVGSALKQQAMPWLTPDDTDKLLDSVNATPEMRK